MQHPYRNIPEVWRHLAPRLKYNSKFYAFQKMDSTDVAVIGGGLSLLACVENLAASGVKATACMATPFQEFALAACMFIADPTQHSSWTAQPSAFQKPGVNYVFDAVVKVDPEAKVITFAKSPQLSYKALIVATGSRCPLISPVPGASFAQRQDEVIRLPVLRYSVFPCPLLPSSVLCHNFKQMSLVDVNLMPPPPLSWTSRRP